MTTRSSMLASILLGTSALLPIAAWADEPAPAAVSTATRASAPTLDQQFQDPPQSARPRVWWHWMNGNVTKDGIAKDLAWMKRVGIGGLQNFDANLQTPQIVDHRLVYMTPEWKDAFRFAATEADRLGLELAIASSPGWYETGGPWVKPEDGMKKLVWSAVNVAPGKRLNGTLPVPPDRAGPYQDLRNGISIEEAVTGVVAEGPRHYGEVGVFAFPVPVRSPLPAATASDSEGRALDAAKLADAALADGELSV